jgi:hypothetical protein
MSIQTFGAPEFLIPGRFVTFATGGIVEQKYHVWIRRFRRPRIMPSKKLTEGKATAVKGSTSRRVNAEAPLAKLATPKQAKPAAESKTAGKKTKSPQKQPSGEHDKEHNESARESTPERARGGYTSPRTEEKVPRVVASASAETEELPFLHLLRHLRLPHLVASSAANKLRQFVAAHLLCRAWRNTHKIRDDLCESGKLAVILVANLGMGGSKLPKGEPNALVRQKHIHTTVHHASQRAAFLLANEYGWGSVSSGPWSSPNGGLTLCRVEPRLTTEHGDPSSCWCYPAQEQVFGRTDIPGVERGGCFNFIATRHSGAFFLETMPSTFYENLPQQAYDGRFVCCKARWRKQPAIDWPHAGAAAAAERQPSHFLLATWHGPHKDKLETCQLCLKELCKHLRDTCDESADCLGCVLAGDFNLDLHQLELADYVGFERLDPDKNVRLDGCRTEKPHPTRLRMQANKQKWSPQEVAQWAGRRRYGEDNRDPQRNVDHMLFYKKAGSPLTARRPRRFRMYDRQRAGLLPSDAGAVTHDHPGALDHDSLILELWLDGRAPAPAPETPSPSPAPLPAPGQSTDPMRGALAAAGEAGQAADEATIEHSC